ncbi:MAG: dihydroorotate dehydrogenase electron transfer subunit [Bacillota bacterium]|jgi:dihydroorotate dehydrogenase electron transfer subunit
MIIENCLITANQQLNKDNYQMELQAPQIAKAAAFGQFIMLKTSETYDPFLKRPMGISSVFDERIRFIYCLKGRGTELLSQMLPGSLMEVMGPIGNGWSIPQKAQKVLVVAGGVGIAPLLDLVKHFFQHKVACTCLWGLQDKEQLFKVEELKLWSDLQVVTEDGSCGEKGYVTLLLPEEPSYDMVYCCGPQPLMAKVAEWAEKKQQPCQVSLGERMGCGVGTCMGCVCKIKEGDHQSYKRVCCDGPVFDSREVIF